MQEVGLAEDPMAAREAPERQVEPDQLAASRRDFDLEPEARVQKLVSQKEVVLRIPAMARPEVDLPVPATVAAGKAVVAEVVEPVELADCPAEAELRSGAREPNVAEPPADCHQQLRRHWPWEDCQTRPKNRLRHRVRRETQFSSCKWDIEPKFQRTSRLRRPSVHTLGMLLLVRPCQDGIMSEESGRNPAEI